jgi:hypothetical protein
LQQRHQRAILDITQVVVVVLFMQLVLMEQVVQAVAELVVLLAQTAQAIQVAVAVAQNKVLWVDTVLQES